jgi:transposase
MRFRQPTRRPYTSCLRPVQSRTHPERHVAHQRPGRSRHLNSSRSRARRDLPELLGRLDSTVAKLTQAIEQEVEKCPEARRLQTHPGVGPLTALAFVLIIGRADRFQCGKQIASYLGLVPLEESSGNRRRLGHITKQGNSLLRFLLVEAAQVTVRSLPEWRSKYFHLAMRRGRKIAKVAMARRLAVQMYWMLRKGWDYAQVKKFGSHAGQLGTGYGVK